TRDFAAAGLKSCATPVCAASGRALSDAAQVFRPAVSNRCSVGTTNAAVLPVPVSAHAIRSRPARASGITAVWIGRVWVYERSRSPSANRESRFRDEYGTGAVSHGNGSSAGARGVAGAGYDGACDARREWPRPAGRRLRGG